MGIQHKVLGKATAYFSATQVTGGHIGDYQTLCEIRSSRPPLCRERQEQRNTFLEMLTISTGEELFSKFATVAFRRAKRRR